MTLATSAAELDTIRIIDRATWRKYFNNVINEDEDLCVHAHAS